MLRRYFFTLLLFLFTLSTQFVCAQEEESEQEEISYSVNVTADRLQESLNEKSDSITIITREEIERHQWHFVQDALRTVSGLSVVRSGSAGKTTSVFVRGASSTQVLFLVDGIQVNDPFFGDVSLDDLTTENIERIEIVKGPQSTLYGSDAIGGVVNIITQKGKGRGFHPRLNFEGGSLETYRERIAVSEAHENADYSLSFTRNDSQGQFENDEYHLNSFSGRGGYKFSSDTNLTLTGRLEDSQIGIPFSGSSPTPFRNQDSRLSLLGTSLQHSAGQSLNLTGRFSWTRVHSVFEDPNDTFSPFSQHDSDVFQIGLQNDFFIGTNNTLTTGYEFEHQTLDSQDTNGAIPELDAFQSNIHALYVQNKFETEHWILTAGVRYDHHDTFGDTTNPRISIAYRPYDQWKIRASTGTAFRAPTAGDLAFPFYGNPDLKPEKSRSWEIGFDRLGNSFTYGATWFYNRYKDLITFDPNTFIAANIAEAKSHGLELNATVQLGNWHLGAAYTYLDTEDEVEKHDLFRRPKHSGNTQFAYESNRWGSSFLVLFVGDRLETDFQFFPTRNVINPGYARTDVTGYYRINSQWKLNGRIENLFDADYEEALTFQAPGVSFFGGVDVSL